MWQFWTWLRDRLGITAVLRELNNMRREMAVDRTQLVRTLAEINESGNKIAGIITSLVQARDNGEQNEVDRLVTQLAPSADFLRNLASTPTEESLNDGGVVPNLQPVGGEAPPQQDPVTQDAAADAEQNLA